MRIEISTFFLHLNNKYLHMKKIFWALVISSTVISCATISKIGSKQESVANTKWTLVDNNFSGAKAPTLVIEGKRITGNGGCNNYFSDVVITASTGTFDVGNVGATKMACDNMMTEQSYFSVLEQVNKYVVNEGYLELYKDNLLLLKFKKQ